MEVRPLDSLGFNEKKKRKCGPWTPWDSSKTEVRPLSLLGFNKKLPWTSAGQESGEVIGMQWIALDRVDMTWTGLDWGLQ